MKIAPGIVHVEFHDRLWIFSILVGIGECLFFINIPHYNPIIFMVFYIFFYLLGERWISPDFDILGLSSQDGRLLQLRQKNILFGILGLFWVIWWLIYAWIINKHRSFWSHGLFIGTLGRVVWLFIPFLFIVNWIGTLNGWKISGYWYEFYADYYLVSFVLAAIFGLFSSDMIHMLLDTEWSKGRLYTPLKEKNERKRKDK